MYLTQTKKAIKLSDFSYKGYVLVKTHIIPSFILLSIENQDNDTSM